MPRFCFNVAHVGPGLPWPVSMGSAKSLSAHFLTRSFAEDFPRCRRRPWRTDLFPPSLTSRDTVHSPARWCRNVFRGVRRGWRGANGTTRLCTLERVRVRGAAGGKPRPVWEDTRSGWVCQVRLYWFPTSYFIGGGGLKSCYATYKWPFVIVWRKVLRNLVPWFLFWWDQSLFGQTWMVHVSLSLSLIWFWCRILLSDLVCYLQQRSLETGFSVGFRWSTSCTKQVLLVGFKTKWLRSHWFIINLE